MALHTLTLSSALQAIQWFPSVVASPAGTNQVLMTDVQALSTYISGPELIGAVAQGNPPNTAAQGILFTASTHGNTTLDTFVATGGGALSTIQVGALVLGVGIPAGTFVAARTPVTGTPTSITLSQAATTTAAGVRIIVSPLEPRSALDPAMGRLLLPQGRGMVRLMPGDYIAVSNTGCVIFIPANEVSYPGSQWTFT